MPQPVTGIRRGHGRGRAGAGDRRENWSVEAVHLILRYAHLVGFAVLLGASVAQYLSGALRINTAMLAGAATQVITGVLLAAPIRDDDDPEPDPVKLGVKLVIAVSIFIMVYLPRRKSAVNRGHFLAIVGMTLLNAAIATFWR